jgi:uncharacterized membrane protein YfcA
MSRTDDISVPPIKYFGTSWYKRGAGYWFKRFWLTFGTLWFILAFFLAFSLFVSVLFDHIKSALGRGIVVSVLVALIFVNLYSTYLKMKRSPEERAAHKPLAFQSRPTNTKLKSDARTAGTVGTVAGVLGGGPIAVLATPLMAGVAFGFFFISLGKYVKEEEWLLAQQYGIEKSKAAP